MSVPVTVMKFGGTSLEDLAGFERVAQLLRSDDVTLPIAVVSAMSGVTDALMTSLGVARAAGVSEATRELEVHFERHMKVANALGSTASARMRVIIDSARDEIRSLLESPDPHAARQDAISSFGEILSAQLLTLVLTDSGSRASYVDARRCIKTDGAHSKATPLVEDTARHTRMELQPLLDDNRLPIMGGFIGSTMEGVTTTMGRGSSNYTATLVSSALNAREVQIWTDVNGVHTADPSLVEQAQTIPFLSYDEAEEMARLGAKVLHRGMFEPIRAQRIPVRIRSSRLSEAEGTTIGDQSRQLVTPSIKAIAHRNHLLRIDVHAPVSLLANGFQQSITTILEQHNVSLEIVARSAERVSIACDEDAPVSAIVEDLMRLGAVEVEDRRAVVGCVGETRNLQSTSKNRLEGILKSFDPKLDWQQVSPINLMTMIDASLVGPLVKNLHQEIFEQ